MPKLLKRRLISLLDSRWFRLAAVLVILLAIAGGTYLKIQNDQKYLVIKEWGVRITLPKSIREKVSYKMGYGDERAQYLIFYSPQLAKEVANCAVDMPNDRTSKVGLGLELFRRQASSSNKIAQPSQVTVKGVRYGHIASLNGYDYFVQMVADNSDGRQPVSQAMLEEELGQVPVGCYKATYPSKPDASDKTWQESKSIYNALVPATYSLRAL